MKDEKELLKFGLEETFPDSCGDPLYSLKDFNGEEFIKRDDSNNIQGVLRYVQDEKWLGSWILLELISSSGEDFNFHSYCILAQGEGPGGVESSLREPRHTYIGKDGYVFYIKPDLLTWGFEKLKKYYYFY